jgi:hypothetical protein
MVINDYCRGTVAVRRFSQRRSGANSAPLSPPGAFRSICVPAMHGTAERFESRLIQVVRRNDLTGRSLVDGDVYGDVGYPYHAHPWCRASFAYSIIRLISSRVCRCFCKA